MTDKQIIDGIDASGCDCFIEKMNFPNNFEGGYYSQNNLCECGVQGVESYPFFCKDNPNCLYKQLKRKEQECEDLKKELEAVYDDCKGCPTCNEALYNANLYAKECRKLKQELNTFKQALDEIRQYRVCEINDVDGEEDDVILGIIDEVMEP